MSDRGIEKEIETAMMDRITEILAQNEGYRQSVEEEQKSYEWLKENLEGEPLEKLNEYFLAVSNTAYHIEKLSYLQGMKDLRAFCKYLDGKDDSQN
ncbi:MAG: hypothetical protein K1W08_11085 [Lachnospiraceae bacterium]|jgi:DNA repair protein RadC